MRKGKNLNSRVYCALSIQPGVLSRRTKASLAKIKAELAKVAADWGELDGSFAEEAEQALANTERWGDELAERISYVGKEAGDWDE